MRQSKESNVLSGLTITNATTGDGTGSRFDNNREDTVKSGEVGLRGKLQTGSVSHAIVASASTYQIKEKGAYRGGSSFAVTNQLNNPQQYSIPTISYAAGDMNNPLTVSRNQLDSFAIGDTMGFANDRFLITIGARHQTIETRSFSYITGALDADNSYKQSHVSPVAGFVWKMKDNLSLYANYIESLSKGPTAPRDGTVSNPGQVFDPYVSKQKEVGMKYDTGRIGGAIAYFTTDKPSGIIEGGVYKIGGEDHHQGLELSVYGKATRDLKILGGITLLDAEQRKTENGINDGNKVIGVPDRQANLGLEWRVPNVQGLSLDTQIVATGSSYADGANKLKVDGWTRLDLGARYMTEVNGKVLTLRANIDNVTDRDYWASVGGNGGSSGYLAAGTPRTIIVSASMDF